MPVPKRKLRPAGPVSISPAAGTVATTTVEPVDGVAAIFRVSDVDVPTAPRVPASAGVNFAGHADTIRRIAYHPQLRLTATCSWDGTVALWSLEHGTRVASIRHGEWVNAVAFGSTSIRSLLTATEDGWLRAWHHPALVPDPTEVSLAALGTDWAVTAATRVSPGAIVAMCVHEETNTVFAAHGVRVHGVHVAASALCTVREYRASAEVMDVAVSDVLLCVATLSGRVLLFDIEGAFALWDLDAHIGAASCLAVVDSSLLLSAGEDGAVRLWALATGVCVQERRNVHRRPISALTYVYGSTDRVLITASTDGSVRCTKQTSGIEVGHFATLATCLCVVPNTDSGKSWGHGPTLLVGGPTGALARYRLDRALTRM